MSETIEGTPRAGVLAKSENISWPAQSETGGLVLLTPGPACTSARVKSALLRGDMTHREPEFSNLADGLRRKLPKSVGLNETHQAILVTGSGTAADEMAIISSVREGRALLVLNNGVYGARLIAIARAYRIVVHEVVPVGNAMDLWTTPISVESVRTALNEHPDIDVVACVHHETTAGLINPIAEIAEEVRRSDALFMTDSISATANEAPDLALARPDIVLGTSNKGLHGFPGISFLLCSERAIERFAEVRPRSLYLSAATYLNAQRNGDVPFTPAVQICYALDEALDELEEAGGYFARMELYRARGALVRGGFERLGLSILVNEQYRSASVTTLSLPQGIEYSPLHDELKKRGYVMYAGQGKLSLRYFRICTFGAISWQNLEQLEPALRESLAAVNR